MDNPDIAEDLEAKVRQKLFEMTGTQTTPAAPGLGGQPVPPAAPAARNLAQGVSIEADDFNDED